MTENVENLMLEILRRLQGDMADVKSRLTSIELQMSSLGQQVGSLTTAIMAGMVRLTSYAAGLSALSGAWNCATTRTDFAR